MIGGTLREGPKYLGPSRDHELDYSWISRSIEYAP